MQMNTSYKHTYSELLVLIGQDDIEAFEMLYNALWRPLFVRVYTILKDRQISEDIVQEVWIDVWQRRKTIKNENIEAYLFRAVRFKAYNHYRNIAKRRTILQNILASSKAVLHNNIEESMNLMETKKALLKSVATLPPKCKKVFELSRFEGLKNKEISQKLSISQRTVENHISNALKVLKTEIPLHSVSLLISLICC